MKSSVERILHHKGYILFRVILIRIVMASAQIALPEIHTEKQLDMVYSKAIDILHCFF